MLGDMHVNGFVKGYVHAKGSPERILEHEGIRLVAMFLRELADGIEAAADKEEELMNNGGQEPTP